MGTYYINSYCDSAIGEDAAAGSQNETEDKTDWSVDDKFWVAVRVYCSSANKDPVACTVSLRWREQGGSWSDLGSSGDLKYPGDDQMVITLETLANTYTIVDTQCSATGLYNPMYLIDDGATSPSIDINDSDYDVEIWWAIDPAAAGAGKTYEFAIYDSNEQIATQAAPQLIASTLQIHSEAGAEYNESITENFGMVESPGLGAAFGMSIVENMSSGEAYSPQAINQVALSELMAMIEQIGSVASYNWKHEELMAMTEATQVHLDLTISATEFGAFTDQKSPSGDYGLLLSENIALSDVLALTQLIRLMTDYWYFAAIIAGAEYNESLTEAVALTDSLHLNLQTTDALIETLAATDLLKAQLEATGNITEALAITDQIKSILSGHILLSEAFAFTDQITAQLQAALSLLETMALTEAVEFQALGQAFSETLTETIALIDQMKASLETSAAITENISLAEVLRLTVQTYLRLSEYISLTDEILAPIGQLFQEVITEALKLSETQQVQFVTHLGISETMSLADAFTAIIQIYLQVREDIGITDTIDIPRLGEEFAEALTETLGISESKAMVIAYGLMLTESLAFYDEKTQTFTFNIKISEDVAIADVIRPILTLGMIITENFTTGDVQILTRTSPTIIIRRGKTFVFTLDTVGPQTGVAPKKGHVDVKKWH